MKKFKNIIVSPSCEISKAVEILQTTDEKIILILEKKKILGTLTDGDIRRAIINNINFKLPVTKISRACDSYLKPSVPPRWYIVFERGKNLKIDRLAITNAKRKSFTLLK